MLGTLRLGAQMTHIACTKGRHFESGQQGQQIDVQRAHCELDARMKLLIVETEALQRHGRKCCGHISSAARSNLDGESLMRCMIS